MNQIKNDHVELGWVYFVFIFRLAFTQLHCVSRKGFLIHGNMAAQPSHFPWLGTSGYLSLPFLLLTVVNFLFSWNGQKLDPWESGLGGITGTVLMEKTPTFLNKVGNIFGTNI